MPHFMRIITIISGEENDGREAGERGGCLLSGRWGI